MKKINCPKCNSEDIRPYKDHYCCYECGFYFAQPIIEQDLKDIFEAINGYEWNESQRTKNEYIEFLETLILK